MTLDQARTAAVMTLTWVGFAVLTIVAAPLNAWRLALIWGLDRPASGSCSLCPRPARSSRSIRRRRSCGLAGIGIAALTWSFARLFVPEERPRSAPGRVSAVSGSDLGAE